jgi:hypothetical protein
MAIHLTGWEISSVYYPGFNFDDEMPMLSKEQIMDTLMKGVMEDRIRWFPLDKLKVDEEMSELKNMKWNNRKTKREMRRLKKRLVKLKDFYPLRRTSKLLTIFSIKDDFNYLTANRKKIIIVQFNEPTTERASAIIWRKDSMHFPWKTRTDSGIISYAIKEVIHNQAGVVINSETYPFLVTLTMMLDQDMILQDFPTTIPHLEV